MAKSRKVSYVVTVDLPKEISVAQFRRDLVSAVQDMAVDAHGIGQSSIKVNEKTINRPVANTVPTQQKAAKKKGILKDNLTGTVKQPFFLPDTGV